jgi:DNA-binding CsgD family transcriptional regulator
MLLGRERERLMLERLIEGARAGRSGVLVMVGEAGIGKSALLAYAEEQASGLGVLRARGVQTEAHIPFAGLFELLRPALGSLRHIPAPQAAALEGALALRPARSQDRFAIGAATLSLLAAYAEAAPVVALVDDAHWLDGSSAHSLLFAIRRLVADPVAVVLATREGESSRLDASGLPTLRLRGLDRDAARELLRRRVPEPISPELADRLHRETGGNPLALVELAEQRQVLDDLALGAPLMAPTRVADVYTRRYRALPARARDVLVLAAASDRGDVSLLARAMSTLGWDLADLVPAETAALVTMREGRVEFSHPLVRSAVYADAAPDQRRAVHRALASVLPEADVDRRAWHLALAALGPDEAASAALEQAGLRARERSAYDVASRAFERGARLAGSPGDARAARGALAPDEARQARLLYAAAETAWLGGLTERAAGLLDEARRRATTPALTIAIDHLRGHILTRRGPIQPAQAILLDAAERAATVDPERAVVMLAEALNASFYAGDPATMRRAAGRVAAITPPLATGRTWFFSLMAQGMAAIFSGDGARGAALVREATELLESSDELPGDPRLVAWAAMGPLWLRDVHSGRRLLERARTIARDQSAVGVLPFLLNHVVLDQATTDRWPAAQAGFLQLIDLARETGQLTDLAAALVRLGWLEARQGRSEPSRRHTTEGLELSRRLGLGVCEVWALAALGDLELGLGRPEPALAHFEEQRAVLRARGIGDVDLAPAPELVELYVRSGRTQEAREAAAAYARDAEAKGQPWALARAERSCGLVAVDDAEVERHLERALALHARAPDVFETARTHLIYGSQLRRGRQRVRAREQLRAAIEIFDPLGAEPWSENARAELAATGETARRRTPATLNDLTPQELQVALRIAEGRTTREAASALFLSPKTIEYHLRSVYRKLGIGSRSELVAAVDQLNVPPS